MRPRRFRRGESPLSVAVSAPSSAGFNEAPAIPPGRERFGQVVSGQGRAASMRPRRFRRGERRRRVPQTEQRSASMRPRRFRRGEVVLQHPRDPARERFNEAPAIPPGRGDGGELGTSGNPRASMRPRRFRRGEPEGWKHGSHQAHPASMRPRRFRRGEGRASSRVADPWWCFNEAPAIPPGRAITGQGIDFGYQTASMRPRRFRRGERYRRRRLAAQRESLQ